MSVPIHARLLIIDMRAAFIKWENTQSDLWEQKSMHVAWVCVGRERQTEAGSSYTGVDRKRSGCLKSCWLPVEIYPESL